VRRTTTIAASVALVGAVLFAAPSPTAHATPAAPEYFNVTIKAHTFNMCSTNDDCGSAGGVAARDLVDWFHASDGPWVIALQEACRSDVQDVLTRTGMAGAGFGVELGDLADCPGAPGGNIRDQGNGILRSGAGLAQTRYFPTQESGPLPCNFNLYNCRNYVCVPMSSYAGTLNVCSAHLDDYRPRAATQANEYIWNINAYYPSGGKFMMGDFNLNPSQIPSVFYSQYWRAPQMNTFKADPLLRVEQIDYVWHDRAHTLNNVLRTPYCDKHYSDHCYAFANIQ